MTFHDCLAALPLNDLKLIASTLGLRPKLVSRARLVREIPVRMFQPGFIESRIDALSRDVQDTLLAVMFTGDRGYEYDAGRPSSRSVAGRLYRLLAPGLIVGRRTARQPPHYIVPTDVRDIVSRHLQKRLADRLGTPAHPPGFDETESLSFIRDVFSFLSGLRVDPARLTDKGALYKRAFDTLRDRLEIQETYASFVRPQHTSRFALMMRYAQARQLIYEDESRLRCSSVFEQWLYLPTTEKLDDLLAFWYGTAHHRSPRATALLGALQLCLDFDGIDLEAMSGLVAACTPGAVSPPVSTHHRMEILELLRELAWLGVLRLYGDRDGLPGALVLTPFGRSVLGNRTWTEEGLWADRFVVQPTYEIIAPRTLRLTVRDELERFAGLTGVDRMLTYRLTRDTLYRAGDDGISGEAVLAFLNRHSEKAVPQNVAYSIREWGDAYGQVYFMDVFLLRTATAEVAQHIKAHKDLGHYVRGEVAPDALIVERHQYRDMMEALRRAGFMPKSQVAGMDAERDAAHHPFIRERFVDVWTRQTMPRTPSQVIGIDEGLGKGKIK